MDILNKLRKTTFSGTVYYSLILIGITLAIYWPVLQGQFLMAWDDQWMVMNWYTETGFTRQNLWAVLTEFYNGQYGPVNELFYMILYFLFGYNPFWFHIACLLIHIANVALVYVFIRRLLLLSQAGFELTSAQRIAFITALLVAIHPLQVEAVAWISASKVILFAYFYLIALITYLKYVESKRRIYFILVLLLYIFSFGSKEQAVILPMCLLLLDYALKRNFRSRQVWLEKIPFIMMALFFGIITMLSQGPINISENTGYPIYQRLVFASYSLVEYIVKYLFPVKLSYLYPFPNQVGEALPWRFWMYPFVVVIMAASLWSFWKRRWVFFGMAFFVVHLAMVLHIISISRFAIVADRYMYLPIIGVSFIVGYYLNKAFLHRVRYLKILLALGLIYIMAIGAYSNVRVKVWNDSDSLKKELREQVKQRNDYQQLKKKLQQ